MEAFSLNLRHLRALASIARLGSMRAAAADVGMSQPALTQGLAKIEQQVGAVLFDRRFDGVKTTAAGRIMVTRADAAFAHLARGATQCRKRSERAFSRPEWLMTSTQVRAFLAVADYGGFAAAAAATGVSAPSLHRAVRDLEGIGRDAFFESRGRGVQLSAGGRRFARQVRLAATEIAAGIAEVGGDRAANGAIVVGAMPLARARVLPAAIANYLKGAPRSDVRIIEGSWRELVGPLQDGVIDFMIGALRDELPADLEQRPLFLDELVIIARSGHPLCERTPTVAELADYGWVMPSVGTPLRAQWSRLFTDMAEPDIPVECGSIMVVRGILAETDLLTLLSPDQVAVEIQSGLLARIGQPIARGVRTVGITWRRGWRPTKVQEQLLAELALAAATKV